MHMGANVKDFANLQRPKARTILECEFICTRREKKFQGQNEKSTTFIL